MLTQGRLAFGYFSANNPRPTNAVTMNSARNVKRNVLGWFGMARLLLLFAPPH